MQDATARKDSAYAEQAAKPPCVECKRPAGEHYATPDGRFHCPIWRARTYYRAEPLPAMVPPFARQPTAAESAGFTRREARYPETGGASELRPSDIQSAIAAAGGVPVRLEDLTLRPGDRVDCDSEFTIDDEAGVIHQCISNVRVTRADDDGGRELCDAVPWEESDEESDVVAVDIRHESFPPPRLSLSARVNSWLDWAWRKLGGGRAMIVNPRAAT